MISYARRHRYALAGLLLSLPALPARADAPDSPPARMPAWVVVKAGKADPDAPRGVEPTSLTVEVGAVEPRTDIPIELKLRNTSSAPVRILGGDWNCSPHGCARAAGQPVSTVAPGETVKVALIYTAPPINKKFQYHANIFIGGTKTFAVPFSIAGEAVATPAALPMP